MYRLIHVGRGLRAELAGGQDVLVDVSRCPVQGAKSTACMDIDPVHARRAWQVEGNASRRSHRPRERMTPVDTGHLFAGRQLRRRSAAGRRDRRTHLGPGLWWEDEGGIEDGRGRSGVLGHVDGARDLEEAVPGADDLGQASAVGGVPEGDRS